MVDWQGEPEDLLPIGYYNVAHSYLDAAEILKKAFVEGTRLAFDAPVRALYAHAWELALKACLRVQGWSVDEIRRTIGHDLERALGNVDFQRFSELKLEPMRDIMPIINIYHASRLHYYPKSGQFSMLHIGDLSDWSRRLRLDRSTASRLFMTNG